MFTALKPPCVHFKANLSLRSAKSAVDSCNVTTVGILLLSAAQPHSRMMATEWRLSFLPVGTAAIAQVVDLLVSHGGLAPKVARQLGSASLAELVNTCRSWCARALGASVIAAQCTHETVECDPRQLQRSVRCRWLQATLALLVERTAEAAKLLQICRACFDSALRGGIAVAELEFQRPHCSFEPVLSQLIVDRKFDKMRTCSWTEHDALVTPHAVIAALAPILDATEMDATVASAKVDGQQQQRLKILYDAAGHAKDAPLQARCLGAMIGRACGSGNVADIFSHCNDLHVLLTELQSLHQQGIDPPLPNSMRACLLRHVSSAFHVAVKYFQQKSGGCDQGLPFPTKENEVEGVYIMWLCIHKLDEQNMVTRNERRIEFWSQVLYWIQAYPDARLRDGCAEYLNALREWMVEHTAKRRDAQPSDGDSDSDSGSSDSSGDECQAHDVHRVSLGPSGLRLTRARAVAQTVHCYTVLYGIDCASILDATESHAHVDGKLFGSKHADASTTTGCKQLLELDEAHRLCQFVIDRRQNAARACSKKEYELCLKLLTTIKCWHDQRPTQVDNNLQSVCSHVENGADLNVLDIDRQGKLLNSWYELLQILAEFADVFASRRGGGNGARFSEQEWLESRDYYQQLLSYVPSDASIWWKLGRCYSGALQHHYSNNLTSLPLARSQEEYFRAAARCFERALTICGPEALALETEPAQVVGMPEKVDKEILNARSMSASSSRPGCSRCRFSANGCSQCREKAPARPSRLGFDIREYADLAYRILTERYWCHAKFLDAPSSQCSSRGSIEEWRHLGMVVLRLNPIMVDLAARELWHRPWQMGMVAYRMRLPPSDYLRYFRDSLVASPTVVGLYHFFSVCTKLLLKPNPPLLLLKECLERSWEDWLPRSNIARQELFGRYRPTGPSSIRCCDVCGAHSSDQ